MNPTEPMWLLFDRKLEISGIRWLVTLNDEMIVFTMPKQNKILKNCVYACFWIIIGKI